MLKAIQLLSEEVSLELGSCVDELLTSQKPKDQSKNAPNVLKHQLEQSLITPQTSLSKEWLDKLQQYVPYLPTTATDSGRWRWDINTDIADLYELSPTQSRTVLRFTRDGLDGKVSGYKEVTVPSHSRTAKNSTSFHRKPADRADRVRGAAGFLPFVPAGLDGIPETVSSDDTLLYVDQPHNLATKSLDRVIDFGTEDGLLQVPPGFTRGLQSGKTFVAINEEVSREIKATFEPANNSSLSDNHNLQQNFRVSLGEHMDEASSDSSSCEEFEDVDTLLPVEFPAFEPHVPLPLSKAKLIGKEWAHMVDVNRKISDFKLLVPDMARVWPFELDTFQKEAIYHLENGDSVFVAAHTSAGKTVVAEYAIALSAKHMTKTIYTSPIKALSNQKYRDFRHEFDDVGILTGDVQVNPEASCLIMTTEILRSMLYRGADLLRDVEFVIFDEVHYVNDLERGVVWEEVIIMLPEHVTLILLSATVPNTYEFASWVGRTKKKDIYVISTLKRPVPLEHYLWADKAMYKIVDADKKFLDNGWIGANAAIAGRKDKTTASDPRGDIDGRPNLTKSQRGGPLRGNQRGDTQSRGRGRPARAIGNIVRNGRGGGRTSAAQDKNTWVHLVQHLKKQALLPACIFVFSKKRCEENSDALSNVDFCTATEKSNIHIIIERSLARLKIDDRMLPQIKRLRELLSRGIAVHHGGLLPIVKEVVEILFAKSLVKVLFATETFAMGLNLPTRTVIFSGFRKHDGRSFRDLLPGEYTQMAGRAGRRGLDPVGTVIILASGMDEAPPVYVLKRMILGNPTRLRSQFRLTYNMILNLLRVEALKIEEMIKRSFSENATQTLLPEQEKQVKLSEVDLAKLARGPCNICDVDLDRCHAAVIAFQSATRLLHLGLLASAVGRRTITAKRLIVFFKDGIRLPGVLLPNSITRGPAPTVRLLSLGSKNQTRQPNDALPYIKEYKRFFSPLAKHIEEMELRILLIPLSDVVCITKTVLQMDLDLDQLRRSDSKTNQAAQSEISKMFISWGATYWDEFDWGRVKELPILDILEKRNEAIEIAANSYCAECPQFLKHFSTCHAEWLLRENIFQLKQLMSDQNLQLLPDYEQRIAVLHELGFIDENSRVELKGKVACEIHSADELVLTELILENVLASFEPEEIVALLSAFVFQEKTDVVATLTGSLEKGKETIIKISEKVNEIQIKHQVILSSVDSNDFTSRPRFGLCEVVYEWARGMSFNRITDLTDVLEGTIVRVITRLDETCREVKNAARIIGDPELFNKMQRAQEMIKRDITAVASLYM